MGAKTTVQFEIFRSMNINYNLVISVNTINNCILYSSINITVLQSKVLNMIPDESPPNEAIFESHSLQRSSSSGREAQWFPPPKF